MGTTSVCEVERQDFCRSLSFRLGLWTASLEFFDTELPHVWKISPGKSMNNSHTHSILAGECLNLHDGLRHCLTSTSHYIFFASWCSPRGRLVRYPCHSAINHKSHLQRPHPPKKNGFPDGLDYVFPSFSGVQLCM